MDTAAAHWSQISVWLFPALWFLLGIAALRFGRRLAGMLLMVAGLSLALFSVLFAPGSRFTAGWETDAPLNVAFGYQPLGFLAANGLPALANIALVVAIALLLGRRS